MKRCLTGLLCLAFVCAVLAAPAPPVFFKPGWDSPVDPDKDCRIVQTEDKLTIELPGTPHDIVAGGKRNNAPRLLRDVKGDFRVDVRVTGEWLLSADSTVPEQPSYAGGGLLFLQGDAERNILRFEFGRMKGEKKESYVAYRGFREQLGGGLRITWRSNDEGWPLPVNAKHIHLRLECRAKAMKAYYSSDGKKWVAYQKNMTYGVTDSAKPKVGLVAFSTSKDRCKVYFDQFNLMALPAER